ncbi:hypothetical protein [Paenibacillus phytohabitans]|nr:hypothetical protein [Paenibacillus phytohabitans]
MNQGKAVAVLLQAGRWTPGELSIAESAAASCCGPGAVCTV